MEIISAVFGTLFLGIGIIVLVSLIQTIRDRNR